MSAIPQQVFASQKASLDKLIAVQGTFLGGFEKLIDLNLKVLKATFDEVAEKSQEAIDLKDPQEALAFASALAQPNAEKALAYGRHVYDIVSGVQADLSRLAEEQISHGRQQVSDLVDQLAKNAPTGAEGAVAMLKSSLTTANNAFESVAKVTKQAKEAAESNLNAATNATFRAASDVAEATSKAASRTTRRAAAAE